MARVTIYSSGAHYGPLKPAAPLRYDMRNVTNPPRQLRGNMDGRSKKLRDHLMNDKDFLALLETIQNDILREIERLQKLECGKEVQVQVGVGADKEVDTTHEIQQSREIPEQECSKDADSHDKEYLPSDGEDTGDETSTNESQYGPDNENEPTVVVNCFCHLGRHRSASMVEELARLKWPAGTDIEVIHRDIDKDRRSSGKQKKVAKSSRMRADNGFSED
ncbi:hypothetical protein AOL_s00076g578 [Orbilia oligospora ATCC 24927]|uniref:RapZ C-terminal domain-containing protein n=1 Tax=Arthrobotrys oligospora (strain ATCC 24927 / CBS 115.81 / DSM 1491) TaxID=756982 RepID=G1XAC0_ARTOA|nr:hypothetical protein AOL_s00076g578 [Orbilia oligospora ATCC 24927]EGX49937.1 hypothetical protein AOL_s00076g578 [Orbilia oligospora ATCC 24927]